MLGSRGRRPKNGEGGKKKQKSNARNRNHNALPCRKCGSRTRHFFRRGRNAECTSYARAGKARLCARIIMCPAIAMRNLMYARKTRIRAEIGDRREGKLQLQRESRNFAIRAKHVVPLPRISVPTAFRHILCRTDTVRGSPHYRDSLEERRNRKHEGN